MFMFGHQIELMFVLASEAQFIELIADDSRSEARGCNFNN